MNRNVPYLIAAPGGLAAIAIAEWVTQYARVYSSRVFILRWDLYLLATLLWILASFLVLTPVWWQRIRGAIRRPGSLALYLGTGLLLAGFPVLTLAFPGLINGVLPLPAFWFNLLMGNGSRLGAFLVGTGLALYLRGQES